MTDRSARLRLSDRAPNLWVADGVSIPDAVHIGVNVVLHEGVALETDVHIEDNAVLGKLTRTNAGSKNPSTRPDRTTIGSGSTIG